MSDDRSVEARLREAGRRSAEWLDSAEGRRDMARRAREARRSAVVDMSPEAIDARLREVEALRALCASLVRARG